MYLLEFTKTFNQDIDNVLEFIKVEYSSSLIEENLFISLHKKLEQIKYMPYSQALITDDFFLSLGYRFIKVKKYFVFYKILEDKKIIRLSRFLHSSRDWKHILKEEDS